MIFSIIKFITNTLTQLWMIVGRKTSISPQLLATIVRIDTVRHVIDAALRSRKAKVAQMPQIVVIQIDAKCPDSAVHRHQEQVFVDAVLCFIRQLRTKRMKSLNIKDSVNSIAQLTCICDRTDTIAEMPFELQIGFIPCHPIDGHPIPRHMLPMIGHHGTAQNRRSAGCHQQRDKKENQRRRCVRTRQHRRETICLVRLTSTSATAAAIRYDRRCRCAGLRVPTRLARHRVDRLH